METILNKVSVIIPLYNKKKTVINSIKSVQDQTYKNIEIIVADDCSTDGSYELVDNYIEENNFRNIKLLKNDRNRGCYAARNMGIKNSTGKYIAFQDPDDFSFPERIEFQMKDIFEKKVKMSFCMSTEYIDNEINEEYNTKIFSYDTSIIEKRLFDDYGTYGRTRHFIDKMKIIELYCYHNKSMAKKNLDYDMFIRDNLDTLGFFYCNKRIGYGMSRKKKHGNNDIYSEKRKNTIYNEYIRKINVEIKNKLKITNHKNKLSENNIHSDMDLQILKSALKKFNIKNISFLDENHKYNFLQTGLELSKYTGNIKDGVLFVDIDITKLETIEKNKGRKIILITDRFMEDNSNMSRILLRLKRVRGISLYCTNEKIKRVFERYFIRSRLLKNLNIVSKPRIIGKPNVKQTVISKPNVKQTVISKPNINTKNTEKITQKYSDFLENKRVIIVGPAEHVNCGEMIDSYDVVVRMNRGHNMIKNPKKYGSRTDILYHCVDQDEECGGKLTITDNIKYYVMAYPHFTKKDNSSFRYGNQREYNEINKVIKERQNIVNINKDKYLQFEKELGCRPNTGTIGIWDILNYNVKELFICGFTLFQTPYSKLYREKVDGKTNTGNQALIRMKKAGVHDQEKIINYYNKLFENKKVKGDKEFIYHVSGYNMETLKLSYYKRKLIYRVNTFNGEILEINNDKIEIKSDGDIEIYKENNRYCLYHNKKIIKIFENIYDINYYSNNSYDLSIVIPISINNLTCESLINFDCILNKLLNMKIKINICISHTENTYNCFIDKIIIDNKLNYIFVKNDLHFNLGYSRNLYKYITNSKKIMFMDIDILLTENQIINMIDKSKIYDIVKPYMDSLIHLSKKEKYEYLLQNKLPQKKPLCLFTITGGITLFDKNIIEDLGGYEELNSYGYEDRFLDALILKKGFTYTRINNTLYHLYHPEIKYSEKQIHKLIEFNKKNYNCFYDKKMKNFIHKNCIHNEKMVEYNIMFNKMNNGKIDLFQNPNTDSINLKHRKNKILIFTDSRGEHKNTFKTKKIFTEKLKDYFNNIDINVDLMLCPFKWTTTIDFIQLIEDKKININDYDFIILYTGIVEYSPRPVTNYDAVMKCNNDNYTYNNLIDRKHSGGRIENDKKKYFEKLFSGTNDINRTYDTKYRGENTSSLISIDEYNKIILPYLKKINKKVIFINSNKCVDGWEGNYIKKNPDGRPSNIKIIEHYSRLTRNMFTNYVDLLKWTDSEIKKYTVDNMHLTYEGSEYIYEQILNIFENKYSIPKTIKNNDKILFVMGNGPSLGEVMNNPKFLEILKENDTFGLNAAYRAYEKYNFYPTYFGCFDYVVNESHKESFENLVRKNNGIKEFYFIGNSEKKQKLYDNDVYNNDRFIKFNFKHINITDYKKISESFDDYYNPGSSGANATQIGILKGYKKIVLLGCDCNYVEEIENVKKYDEKHKNRLVLKENVNHNPNYWFNNYQIKGDKFNLPNTGKFQMGSWKNIYNCKPPELTLLNCSTISKIPFFEKLSFSTFIDREYNNFKGEIRDAFDYIYKNDYNKFYFDYNLQKQCIKIWFNKREKIENYFTNKIKNKDSIGEDISITNNFSNKFLSIILIIKNRREKTKLFVENMNNINDINKYAELIIIEDLSNNMVLEKDLCGLNYECKHFKVNTDVSWSRSQLVNYGLKKSNKEYVLIADVDFVFRNNFISEFRKTFKKVDINNYGIAFPVVETNDVFNIGGNKIRNKFDLYGHVYIFNRSKIIESGGYNYNNIGHGFEERELWLRCLKNNYHIIFFNNNKYKTFFTLHLSHNDFSRGISKKVSDREILLEQLCHQIINNEKIKFEYHIENIN
jgi:glycosyltransferase involved in cell wall biosynthesis